MDSQDNVDARTALGVNPGHRPGKLRIHIDSALRPSNRSSSRPTSPKSPIGVFLRGPTSDLRPSSGDESTSPHASTSKEGFKRLRRPTLSRKLNPTGLTSNRGQYETQKLLSHLLDRLEARQQAPDLLDRAALAARQASSKVERKSKRRVVHIGQALVSATQNSVKGHKPRSSSQSFSADADESNYHFVEEGEWYTDDVCDLVEQMRDLLILADLQHMELFSASQLAPVDSTSYVDPKRKGSMFTPSGFVPRVKDNDFDGTVTVSGPKLLNRLAEVVRSLLMVDCIHATVHFSPRKPPYALQAVCLDVAAVLYHRGDLDIQCGVIDAVAVSLYGMGDALRDKVCKWLEVRLGEQLQKLAEDRGGTRLTESPEVEWNDPFGSPLVESPTAVSISLPTFAFSSDRDEPEPVTPDAPKTSGWMRYSPTSQSPAQAWDRDISGVLSTLDVSGQLPPRAMKIAALVPRILVVLTSTIDLTTANLTTIYRVHRLLSLILMVKPDASLDLLELVALGPLDARRRAMNVLTTFFPEAMGHNVIARRPALSTYHHHRAKWETGQDRALAEDDTEGHCWTPWKADSTQPPKCYSCHQHCVGFCVRCSLCGDTKHVDCLRLYRDELFECNVTDVATKAKRTSRMRFSKRMGRVDELVLDGGSTRGTAEATTRKVGKHNLHMVNLFTITLCAECNEPLWGASAQGYACMGLCQQFFHPACVAKFESRASAVGSQASLCRPGFDIHFDSSQPSTRDRFTISASALKSSFEKVVVRYDPEHLQALTYGELMVQYGQLWVENECYRNGLESGSLKIEGASTEDPSGMDSLLSRFKSFLDKANLEPSRSIINFCRAEGYSPEGNHDWLWRPRYLQYCAALLKSPPSSLGTKYSSPSPGGLLTVQDAAVSPGIPDTDMPTVTYEALDMDEVRRILASDLQLEDDTSSSIFLEQLRALGFCGVPLRQLVNNSAVQDSNQTVTFPIPLLMDSSPAVELLVLAVEQLLDDIDLTANEQGLNLLYHRAWPTTMCSPYALERLGGAVLSWIMAEDDVLHHIVKNYASKDKRLPGVRRVAKDTAAVATYKDDRNMLLMRYAHSWLEALHNLDPAQYSDLAYDRCKIIDDRWEVVELAKGEDAGPQAAGFALERLTALADADVSFSVTLDLLIAWLDDVGGIVHEDVVYRSLPRLLRHTSTGLGTQGNLWELAQATSTEGAEGLERVCRWLRVMACSGVEVPWLALEGLMDISVLDNTSDEARFDLVTAIHVNASAMDPVDYASLCNAVLTRMISTVVSQDSSLSIRPSQRDQEILITCMTMVLRAYGTLPEEIEKTTLNTANYRKQAVIHVKRKPHFLARQVLIPLSMDTVISAANLLAKSEYPAEMTLDFLWLLFAKTPMADNVDGFLHHVCPELYEAIWPLYDQQVDRRSRARVFLKLLTITTTPIERMVGKQVEFERAVVRERLLTFVLELADKQVTQDVTGWQRCSTGLILQLFNDVLDPSDPDPQNLVVWRALLPAQLDAISLCFEDHLLFGSDEQRLVLLAQLLHLQPILPTWPIIGWKAVEEIVAEQLATIQQFETADTVQALAALSDAWSIRASTLALGLYMLASGVPCEWKVIQRFQQHVAAACAQPWPIPADAITGILLPALKQVLDSAERVTIRMSGEDDKKSKKTALVGSQFVSVVISFAAELSKWDFMVQRYILDILMAVFFKHNVQPVERSALETLETLALYTLESTNAQNAIMGLQVLRTAQSHMAADRFSRVLPQLFVIVSDVLAQAKDMDRDSVLIESARSFLQDSLRQFGQSGLVLQVLRVDGMPTDRQRPPDSVARAFLASDFPLSDESTSSTWLGLLCNDLSEVQRWNRERIGHVLVSLNRLTSKRKEAISEDDALAFGNFLSRLSKQAAEWDSLSTFDANQVLEINAALLGLCPPESSVILLHQIATFLHMALNRFNIKLKSLEDLVLVSARVARERHTEDTVLATVFDMAGASLSGIAISPVTLRTLLQFIAGNADSKPLPFLDRDRDAVAVEASSKCLGILVRSHPTFASCSADIAMPLLDAAAAVIIRAENASPGSIGLVLRPLPSEAAIVQLHVLGHVLFASLDIKLGSVRNNLVMLYPIMARAISLCLFASSDLLSAADPNNDGAYFVTVVYNVARLAILAVNDPGHTAISPATQEALSGFWRRIWPDWERLLMLAIAPSCINPPLHAVVLSVVEDTVIFVAQASPLILVEPAPLIARGLRAIEEFHTAAGTPPTSKLSKAVAALESTATANPNPCAFSVKRPTIVKSIWSDMLATERLHAASERGHERERPPTRVAFR